MICQEKHLTPFSFWCTIPKVMEMDEILEQALLFDFYGELLSERQKEVYQFYVFDNLSLSEIAREVGMSRQGVHDLVRRSKAMLEEYEQKLHLVEKFVSIKEKVQQIDWLLDTYESTRRMPGGIGRAEKVQTAEMPETSPGTDSQELLEKIRKISDLIIEEL